jgi:hypothetical protein
MKPERGAFITPLMAEPWHIATFSAQAFVVAANVRATSTTTFTTSKDFILIIVWVGIQQLLQPC